MRGTKKMIPFDGFYVIVWDGVGCTGRQFFFETEVGAIRFIAANSQVITRPIRACEAPRGTVLIDSGRLIS